MNPQPLLDLLKPQRITEIVDIAQRNGISLDLSPLGFFHYHLN